MLYFDWYFYTAIDSGPLHQQHNAGTALESKVHQISFQIIYILVLCSFTLFVVLKTLLSICLYKCSYNFNYKQKNKIQEKKLVQ